MMESSSESAGFLLNHGLMGTAFSEEMKDGRCQMVSAREIHDEREEGHENMASTWAISQKA